MWQMGEDYRLADEVVRRARGIGHGTAWQYRDKLLRRQERAIKSPPTNKQDRASVHGVVYDVEVQKRTALQGGFLCVARRGRSTVGCRCYTYYVGSQGQREMIGSVSYHCLFVGFIRLTAAHNAAQLIQLPCLRSSAQATGLSLPGKTLLCSQEASYLQIGNSRLSVKGRNRDKQQRSQQRHLPHRA